MRHFFKAEQWLPYPVDFVFAFFANPENLPRLMPRWQKSRIDQASFVPPPSPPGYLPVSEGLTAGAGTRMTISFRPVPLSPIRLTWDAEITEFAWNDHFCDVQLHGPFAYWRHCHRLQSQPKGNSPGTLLRDEVEYEMRAGVLGEVAARLFAERQFRGMFDHRHRRTSELMAAPRPSG